LKGVISDETGSGALVFATSPTLVTPTLGVATATTLNKVTITAPASAATLTIPDGVTLTGPAASGTAMTLGNTETITGAKTFGSAGAVGRLKVAGTTSGSTILDATAVASGTLTLPAATDTLVGKATTDTLTNKTFDTAGTGNVLKINGTAITANTGSGNNVLATSPTISQPNLVGTTTNDNASVGSVGEYVYCVANPSGTPGSTTTVTITIASPGVVTWAAHGLTGNSPVVFSTTGALPTGITAGTVYWVVGASITTNTFQIATSIANAIAGTAVNTSGSQSGVQSGQSEVPLTTGNPFNLCGVSLTAGDWDVAGSVYFDGNAATTIGYLFASVGTTSATLNQTQDAFTIAAYPSASFGTVNPITVHFGPTRISLASTTTMYMVVQGSFAVNTMKAFGLLRARRVR
jgi:hypothetical protein